MRAARVLGDANFYKFWMELQEQNWFILAVCVKLLDVIILPLALWVLEKDFDYVGVWFFLFSRS
jgi:hypothetical protein